MGNDRPRQGAYLHKALTSLNLGIFLLGEIQPIRGDSNSLLTGKDNGSSLDIVIFAHICDTCSEKCFFKSSNLLALQYSNAVACSG
jgi:hypothetical protein